MKVYLSKSSSYSSLLFSEKTQASLLNLALIFDRVLSMYKFPLNKLNNRENSKSGTGSFGKYCLQSRKKKIQASLSSQKFEISVMPVLSFHGFLPNGKELVFPISTTPSDKRGYLNWVSSVIHAISVA